MQVKPPTPRSAGLAGQRRPTATASLRFCRGQASSSLLVPQRLPTPNRREPDRPPPLCPFSGQAASESVRCPWELAKEQEGHYRQMGRCGFRSKTRLKCRLSSTRCILGRSLACFDPVYPLDSGRSRCPHGPRQLEALQRAQPMTQTWGWELEASWDAWSHRVVAQQSPVGQNRHLW